jgi:hypothetical protein
MSSCGRIVDNGTAGKINILLKMHSSAIKQKQELLVSRGLKETSWVLRISTIVNYIY